MDESAAPVKRPRFPWVVALLCALALTVLAIGCSKELDATQNAAESGSEASQTQAPSEQDPGAPESPEVDLRGRVGVVGNLGLSRGGRYGYRQRRRTGRHARNAVPSALGWLARHQRTDGSWSSEGADDRDADCMVTGLALLAFLWSGNTPRYGKHQGVAQEALDWVMGQQREDGSFGESSVLAHAICGITISEALRCVASRPEVGVSAQKAVDYSCNVLQTASGGWAKAGESASLDTTVWFLMQLKSAKNAALEVPEGAFEMASGFLSSVTVLEGDNAGQAANRPGEPPTSLATAHGIVCRSFLGADWREPLAQAGGSYLALHLPRWEGDGAPPDLRYVYFGRLAAFQVGREAWLTFGRAAVDGLLDSQVRDGDEEGSWEPLDPWSHRWGRAYSTAVSILCFEVYVPRPPRQWTE